MVSPDSNRRAARSTVDRLMIGADDVECDIPLELTQCQCRVPLRVVVSQILSVAECGAGYLISHNRTLAELLRPTRKDALGGVSSNFAFLDPTLTYDPNNVFLELVRNIVSGSPATGTSIRFSSLPDICDVPIMY